MVSLKALLNNIDGISGRGGFLNQALCKSPVSRDKTLYPFHVCLSSAIISQKWHKACGNAEFEKRKPKVVA